MPETALQLDRLDFYGEGRQGLCPMMGEGRRNLESLMFGEQKDL